jgi:hypothetical protein
MLPNTPINEFEPLQKKWREKNKVFLQLHVNYGTYVTCRVIRTLRRFVLEPIDKVSYPEASDYMQY